MTMQTIQQEGREMMRRAIEAGKAAEAARSLRERIKAAKAADIEPIKRDAEYWRGNLPAYAATFSDIIAEANAKTARPAKKARTKKDTRPRWGVDERRMYDIKLHELIDGGKSNREAAQAAIEWAKGNPKLAEYKTPSASSLEKWAASERALMARKRKRAR